MRTSFRVNGQELVIAGHHLERLLDVLREHELTGTKEGCGEGECGACTVLMNGRPVLSCLVPLVQCGGAEFVTVEGVAASRPQFLDEFIDEGGVQCGACTPGIIVSAAALLEHNPRPTRAEVQQALAGNLCRCTGYEGIYRALVSRAASSPSTSSAARTPPASPSSSGPDKEGAS